MSIQTFKSSFSNLVNTLVSYQASCVAFGASSVSLLNQATQWGGKKVYWIARNTWPQYFLSAIEIPWGLCFMYQSGVFQKMRSWCRLGKEQQYQEPVLKIRYLAAGILLTLDGVARIALEQMYSDRNELMPCSERLPHLKDDMGTCFAAKEIYQKLDRNGWQIKCANIPDGMLEISGKEILAGDETRTSIPVALFFTDQVLEKYEAWSEINDQMCKLSSEEYVEKMQRLNYQIKMDAYENVQKCTSWDKWNRLEHNPDFETYRTTKTGQQESTKLAQSHLKKC